MKNIPLKYKAYMLRTCKADMTSYNGFNWPEKGYKELYMKIKRYSVRNESEYTNNLTPKE
jgi:hypothetical protein